MFKYVCTMFAPWSQQPNLNWIYTEEANKFSESVL